MRLGAPFGLLAAVVLPVIIVLYMLKKRTRPQVVSSIRLWSRLDRTKQPSLRLSKLLQNLLLALQLLTALLLVLVLAKPVLNQGTGYGGERIVIIDTSISMAVKERGKTRFQEALSQVESLIRNKSAGERFALVGMGEEASVISGFNADSVALLAALSTIEINCAKANPDKAMALVTGMAEAEEGAAITLFSAGCFGSLARRPERDFEFIVIGQAEAENLLIENLTIDGDRLYVTVANNGTAVAAGQVEIFDAHDQLGGRRDVSLAPSDRKTLVWRDLPYSPWLKAELASPTDQLALDNSRYCLAAKPGLGRLLLVSEGNLFLERALLLFPGLSVHRLAPVAYTSILAAEYDLFVFDGFLPPELPPAPILVFDPPHPNQHFGTGEAGAISSLRPLSHPLLDYVDFSEVSIGLGKAVVGGSGLLEFERGLLATVFSQQEQPLVVFGFALQGGDLPLRPAFPILLSNILASFKDGGVENIDIGYGERAPTETVFLTAAGGEESLAAGSPLGVGVYAFSREGNEKLAVVNPPITTDSIAAHHELAVPGGPIEGKTGTAGFPLLWPLVLAALVFVGIEWRLDNYGR